MTTTVPHQALYRRWRAQTFAEIVGQEAVVETLRNAVRTGPGQPRGPVRRAARHGQDLARPDPRQGGQLHRTSRTATRATRCPSCVSIREGTTLDLIEIDAASNRGIDDVRDLRERLPYPPGQLRRKVYILDEAHQITTDAWNALLKSLEEPPDFVVFMFASTEPSGFPPAILSRLQRYDVRRLTVRRDRGQAHPHPRRRRPRGRPRRDPPDRPARRRRHARRRVDARPAAVGRARADRRGDRPRPARPGRRRGRRGVRRPPRRAATARPGVALLDALDERGRDLRGPARPGGRGDPGRAGRLALATRRPSATIRWRWRQPAGVSRPSTRTAPAIGGLRFQLELAMFLEADGGQRGGRTSRPARRLPAARRRPRTTRRPVRHPSPPAQRLEPQRSRSRPHPTAAAWPAAHGHAAEPTAPSPSADARASTPAPAPTTAAARRLARRSRRRPPAAPGEAPPPRPPPPIARAGRRTAALEELLAAWPAIVERLSAHPPTKPLIVALPAGRGRRRDRHPRLPGGAGLPQGAGRAPDARHRGRHRRGHRPPGHRSLRGRQRRAARRPASGRPRRRSPTHLRGRAGRRRRRQLTRPRTVHGRQRARGCGRLTGRGIDERSNGWGWATCSAWRSRCSRR